MSSQLDELMTYTKDFFGTSPEYLWESYPDAAVFRHEVNKKWYAIVMHISYRKLGIDSDEMLDILDVKCDPQLLGSLLQKEGCHPAYHMNKSHWLTVRLDGTVPFDEIIGLLEMSYDLIKPKITKKPAKRTV